jgi:hypothetical protein
MVLFGIKDKRYEVFIILHAVLFFIVNFPLISIGWSVLIESIILFVAIKHR